MPDNKSLLPATTPGKLSLESLKSSGAEALLPIGIFGILLIMIVPIPPMAMDLLLTFSITMSLLMLFVAIYTVEPLDFSVFPSLLLVVTLLRLSLNIGTTRLILLRGADGPDAAGNLIEAFGKFVVGGNYVVGLIIFIILVIINFVVITKGAGRIAEVSARFTLDAMPGKQMSIDADLNAGLINEDQARKRRRTVEQEADFYGAMDGASKFVRGDAIAGIIIMMINLVAGLVIGIMQHGLSVADASRIYMLLTVGDGLVSQIPSLIVSTAAGLVVTRAAGEKNLSKTLAAQLVVQPRAMGVAGAMLALFGLIPGMPLVPFWALAAGAGSIAFVAGRNKDQAKLDKAIEAEEIVSKEQAAADQEDVLNPVDLVSLEVGYGLISLVDPEQKGDLLERIKSLRREFGQEWGFIVPPVHIRDNLELGPPSYSILIKGCEVASGELHTGHMLAMAMEDENLNELSGTPTVEPAFGLPARWIPEADKEKAASMGFTVVDLSTVITTHLTEVLKTHLHELLTRQETQNLIDTLAKKFPKVTEGVIPELVDLGTIQRVLQNLLAERVPIRDLMTIIETLAEKSQLTKDVDLLTEHVRQASARYISRQHAGADGKMHVLTLDRQIEDAILGNLKKTDQGMALTIDPASAQKIITGIESGIDRWGSMMAAPIICCLPAVRSPLHKLTEKFFPQLVVLSHSEIASNVILEPLGMVEMTNEAA